jgi:hypothetical protein
MLFEIEDYPTTPSKETKDKWSEFARKYKEKLDEYNKKHSTDE